MKTTPETPLIGCVEAALKLIMSGFILNKLGGTAGKFYSRPFSVTGKWTSFFMRKEIRNDQSNS